MTTVTEDVLETNRDVISPFLSVISQLAHGLLRCLDNGCLGDASTLPSLKSTTFSNGFLLFLMSSFLKIFEHHAMASGFQKLTNDFRNTRKMISRKNVEIKEGLAQCQTIRCLTDVFWPETLTHFKSSLHTAEEIQGPVDVAFETKTREHGNDYIQTESFAAEKILSSNLNDGNGCTPRRKRNSGFMKAWRKSHFESHKGRELMLSSENEKNDPKAKKKMMLPSQLNKCSTQVSKNLSPSGITHLEKRLNKSVYIVEDFYSGKRIAALNMSSVAKSS
ncbi:hypothetical protein RRG08_067034 [Elysia crispata]|uniref:Uncharacterized protein n=1 Tax=Elysia crispata TaxID=231223 RepID=A0AAE1DQH7_9GAST|nr:hypothetical protein RRG08_067034 [Elysia crispata]